MSKRSYNSEEVIANILQFVDEEEDDDFDDDLQDLVGNGEIDINELENEGMLLQLLFLYDVLLYCYHYNSAVTFPL